MNEKYRQRGFFWSENWCGSIWIVGILVLFVSFFVSVFDIEIDNQSWTF